MQIHLYNNQVKFGQQGLGVTAKSIDAEIVIFHIICNNSDFLGLQHPLRLAGHVKNASFCQGIIKVK